MAQEVDRQEARRQFKQGQRDLEAPLTKGRLRVAKRCFKQARRQDPEFSRALGWLSYALVTEWVEGWSERDVLDEALDLARQAVEEDGADYDNHYALALVHLYREEWDASRACFELALDLDIEGNRHLMSDYAAALVYFGDNDDAIKFARKAQGLRDWHRWNLAFAYFFKGGEELAAKKDSVFFDLALDEISCMHLKPSDAKYLTDAQLLVGVIHGLRGDKDRTGVALKVYRSRRMKRVWSSREEIRVSPFDTRNPRGKANHDLWQRATDEALRAG